ncbi:hypothetical protein PFBG_05988, partial [Plasmodium falciparum 7G8]
EEEEEDEEEDVPEDTAEDTTQKTEETQKEGEAPTTQDNAEKPCEIVKELFSNVENLKQACPTKYGKNAPTSWKCISDTTTGGEPTGNDGAICIPPRRRKMYIGPLKTWANNSGNDTQVSGEAQTQGSSNTTVNVDDGLLKAFVESAAVETFFLWDRYKKENKPQNTSQLQLLTSTLENSGEQNPQTSLQKGHIPPDFLRQMFYTLADYKDILYSGSNDTTSVSKDTPSSSSNDNLKNIVLEASGNTEEGKKDMRKIQEKLKTFFSNSGDKPSTVTSGPSSVKPGSNSGNDPASWWKQHAESIWKGMVCALTYEESGAKGQSSNIQQNSGLKSALLDTNNKPKNTQYQYKTVELKDNDENGAKSTQSSASGTKLTDFVLRPTYFRYLEEWGETFCKERKKRLEKIKYECRNSEQEGKRHCSGDGHDCTENGNLKHKDISADLYCPDCYKQCRKYKKWIDIKFVEYHKQENKYEGERGKLTKDKSGG